MMMRPFIYFALCVSLTSCATLAAPQNAYDDLGDRLSITFLDNPKAKAGTCNPIIEAAYYSSEQAMPLEITMHVNVKDKREVGVVMLPSRKSGLLIGRSVMSPSGAIDGTCKQMHLRLSHLQCWNSKGTDTISCPGSKITDGLRRFGYVNVSYSSK